MEKSDWEIAEETQKPRYEKDLVDLWGPCLLRLLSPEWFRSIFRKRYGAVLLLVIYAACTVGAVLGAEYQEWYELSTALFIIPWVCTFSFLVGDITSLAYNQNKKDDENIGSFRVIVAYTLFVLSSGGLYTTLWLWHRTSFSSIEAASPAEAWNILVPTAFFVAPGVGFSTSVALSIGANWLVGSIAFLTHILFAFVVVVAFMDFKAWAESQNSSSSSNSAEDPYEDDYSSTAVSSVRGQMPTSFTKRNAGNNFFQ